MISNYEQQLIDNDLPGINADYSESKKTYQNIKEYARHRKLIFLPSHVAESAQRIENKITLETWSIFFSECHFKTFIINHSPFS